MFADELRRVFYRPRNLIILALIGVVPILLGVVVKVSGAPHAAGGPPFFAEITQNALFLPLAALASMETLLLPLVVAIVAGDSVAGDAANGSLRLLVTRRTSRLRILNAKVVASLVFVAAVAAVIVVVGMIAGYAFFPRGELVTLSGIPISVVAGIGEVLEAGLVVAISLTSVALIGVFVSTFTSSSLAATAIAITVAIASEVLDAIPQLKGIRPLLLTNYWSSFIGLFRQPQVFGPIYKDLLEQLGWVVLAFLFAAFNFVNKDILS